MNGNWKAVSRGEPCPVCGHGSWCMVSRDGGTCICRRVESGKPNKAGDGWIHVLKRVQGPGWGARSWETARVREEPPNPAPAHFAALPRGDIQARLCRYLANELGVTERSLMALDVRWDQRKYAAAFPMYSASGLVNGIRYRQLRSGSKWSLKGGHDGVFGDALAFGALRGEDDGNCGELIVCEGASDCAAMMSAFERPASERRPLIVGRSSCMTGTKILKALARSERIRRVTIVADNDAPKTRPDGSVWRPGIDGAERLAGELGISYRIVLPPPGVKDFRQWYGGGGMCEEKFREVADWQVWRLGKEG